MHAEKGSRLLGSISTCIPDVIHAVLIALHSRTLESRQSSLALAARTGHRGIKAARAQYDAWKAIAESARWKTPEDVKKSHPKASILKGGRVVFNIKANDYRLIALVQYHNGIMMIRFFGTHEEYDKVDAERV